MPAEPVEMNILDNRFRIDPTMSQVTFVIRRESESKSVVLVRPDGKKYYKSRHPDYVYWQQTVDMDIVSISNPMPGPWQAIGKVSSDNKVQIMTDLKLHIDDFPSTLYEGETIKMTARILLDGKKYVRRDFINKVALKVSLVEVFDDTDSPEEEEIADEPRTFLLGRLKDDGNDFDEMPRDGIFTAEFHINVSPGKYKLRAETGNGIFFRAIEQDILVYPSPVMAVFKQSRRKINPHLLLIESDSASIQQGSLAVHAEFTDDKNKVSLFQGNAVQGLSYLEVNVTNFETPGIHKWQAWIYATDKVSARPLIFPVAEQTFEVEDFAVLEQARKEKEAQEEAQRLAEEAAKIEEKKAADKSTALITIIGGNTLLLILFLTGWFVMRKIKAKRLAAEEGDDGELPGEDEPATEPEAEDNKAA
ncbi:TIGR03503 family protein [Veronia pacifica]|uniref:TIGR03503 family protein n=1 Tax=Veronia pacifica TaxID=1080227 RepID=A0A1C3EES2_9GAMM|nr:TIGR03503 family protein [Veronia pacifica]